jgi:hypothetical protein
MSDASEVDLRFGKRACGLEQVGVRIVADDLAREVLDVFRQSGIGENRDAEAMATRVARGARLAPLRPRTWAAIRRS